MLGLSRLRIGLLSSSASSIGGGGSFSPLSLFASGEQGAWYDPSDLSTMFQDTAGTTPVTATGQTVGLLLDKSKGLVLGPELVTNGTFDANVSGWGTRIVGTSVAWSGGAALVTSGGTDSGITQAISTTAGTSYRVTVSVTNNAAGTRQFCVELGSFAGGSAVQFANLTAGSSGTYNFVVRSTGGGLIVRTANAGPVAGETYLFDNISVKELPGNHATQATAASRPIYGIEPFGGRRNLLTYTEQFDNVVWAKSNATITPNAAVAPDGTMTADKIVPNTASAQHNVTFNTTATAAIHTLTVYAKADGYNWVWFNSLINSPPNDLCWFDLNNGVTGTTQVNATTSIVSVGDGWFRCVCTWAAFTGANPIIGIYVSETDNQSGNWVGDGTSGVLLWGAQLETGSTATAYQRVTDQWNVTQAGVPSVSYIQCDGTDDFLLTGTITPGVDKAQVFAGVRKLSDAAIGMVAETSSNAGSNNGSLYMAAPLSTGANSDFAFSTRGTSSVTAAGGAALSPISRVLTGIGDIAADTSIIRINGAQAAQSTADQGTGNYLAYPLYIGRRNGTLFPFNGRIYQMIVRFGANLSAATITQTENYTAGKTGIYTVEQLIRLNTLNASGVSYNAYAAADSNGNNYPVTNTVLAADGTPYGV